MSCTCTKGHYGDVEITLMLDTSCPTHGFPRDEWYAGHPLRRHALMVPSEYGGPDRIEKPSETYARLMQEANRAT